MSLEYVFNKRSFLLPSVPSKLESFEEVKQVHNDMLTVLKTLLNSLQVSAASSGLSGTKEYYVATSSGGAVTTKLTFVNGILTSET